MTVMSNANLDASRCRLLVLNHMGWSSTLYALSYFWDSPESRMLRLPSVIALVEVGSVSDLHSLAHCDQDQLRSPGEHKRVEEMHYAWLSLNTSCSFAADQNEISSKGELDGWPVPRSGGDRRIDASIGLAQVHLSLHNLPSLECIKTVGHGETIA